MKRIYYYIALCFAALTIASCKEVDNYGPPSETLRGTVIDAGTGKPLQGEVSGENGTGTRIKMLELSWSDNPTPFYVATMQDGSFNNTKIFAGKYKMSAEGAFVSLIQPGATPPVDQSQTVDVKGVTTVNFSVEPLLRVEWVGEPVLNSDGTITAKAVVTRGTTNPAFQGNVTDINLYINNTKYVGNNNYDNRFSKTTGYSATNGNAVLGQTLTITTIGGAVPTKRDFYLRVGARTALTVDGQRVYNYNEPKLITIP
ncbi:MAG: DUF3823 domain-containing protein [Pyrinomonadaceae bacterium]|nr:DUF3823 domain-containing protein [Sphingobacteriaceae bacterium]